MLDAHGQKVFRAIYGDIADNVQGLMDKPDLGMRIILPKSARWLNDDRAGWYCNTISYGFVYGHLDILNQLEKSYDAHSRRYSLPDQLASRQRTPRRRLTRADSSGEADSH